ncbi:MAG TPA: peptide-methionine (S)-S-oxide reductase MsrA [Gemmatimonadales bacterium]|jgi:peptide-methionine (S)-S-oxide reductase|nr:peptide-methionine (S)-S-oxide reductase MsrA [Gemmatimonadales bacterium]
MLTTPLTLWLALSAGLTSKSPVDTAVFAGGCFWGIEAVFEHTKGVISATAGYAGGHTPSPSYEAVSSGETGHAEAVRVVYDPGQVTYGQLLAVFFTVAHDPTELDRQGPDQGTNYRSIAFYRDSTQHTAITTFIAGLERRHVYPNPVVTEVVPLKTFYEAEGYHQHYMEHHPDQLYIVYNDAPKVAHLKESFPALYRDSWQ